MEPLVHRADGPEDDARSLAIYNTVWPRVAVSMDEVDSYKRSVLAWADHLVVIDDEPVGSAFVAIQPSRPYVGSASITVLAPHRGRGAGSALYRDVSAWCAAQGIVTIEAPIEGEDEASLEFARRRGFTEIERYGRMILDLADVDPPQIGGHPRSISTRI